LENPPLEKGEKGGFLRINAFTYDLLNLPSPLFAKEGN
jgi:hypothetical protein